MSYVLSKRSLASLEGVDARLVSVAKRAIQITKQDFVIIEGLRTREQMMINYGKGRTSAQLAVHGIPAKYAQPKLAKVTNLKNPFASNHASGKAIDVVPYPVDRNSTAKFKAIADAFKQAAKELNVNLTWGGDWKSLVDLPHFEVK